MPEEKSFEWRVGWSASSMAAFRGKSEWHPFGGWADTTEEVESQLEEDRGISDAFETVINASGLEWWLEVREVAADKEGTE